MKPSKNVEVWVGLGLLAAMAVASAVATDRLADTFHCYAATRAIGADEAVCRRDDVEHELATQHQLDIYGTLACLVIIGAGAVRARREHRKRERSEQHANEASALLDSIIAHMPHQVVVKTAHDLRYVRVNRAAELAFGRANLVGMTSRELYPEWLAEELDATDRAAIASGQLVELRDLQVPTATGMRWLHPRTLPIPAPSGAPKFIVTIFEDVEDRANQLARSQEQLLQAQKMEAIGRLAGGVAHDFNNLLTVILGNTEMVCDVLPADAAIRAELEEVRSAAERAAGLTRQLLAFSRRQVLTPKIVDLNDVIDGMHKLLQRVIGEDVELRTIEDGGAEPVRVDPTQIEQVLLNLAINARDAMPGGGSLTLETSSIERGGVRYSVIEVADSGQGMDDATKARIFEPFFTTKPPGKGTGLGLATVFGIVEQSGGSIEVASELGKGTTFRLYFPVVRSVPAAKHAPVARALPGGTETVLLVEDEDGVRNLVRNALIKAGYRVLEAKHGEHALAVAAAYPGEIDLLLSDVVMPRMGGRELLTRIAPSRPHLRVLFMSGYTDDLMLHHGIDRDFAFIQKPITAGVLLEKIRSVMQPQSLAPGRVEVRSAS